MIHDLLIGPDAGTPVLGAAASGPEGRDVAAAGRIHGAAFGAAVGHGGALA